MARYEFNFNLYDSEPEKYKELEGELTGLFGDIEKTRLDSTYEFDSEAEDSRIVCNLILARLEGKLAITFRVKNLDGDDWVDGETELGHMMRLAYYHR